MSFGRKAHGQPELGAVVLSWPAVVDIGSPDGHAVKMQERQEGVHVLSFGGGVNSVALMVLLMEGKEPLDEAVFADTGAELPETYEYVEVARDYLASRGVPLTTVRRKGETLYETCERRAVIPSAVWRWSTRDFKVRPIHRYYRALGRQVNQYVAIAFDELERMRTSDVPYVTNLYPLVDRRLTRDDCVSIIERAGLPVPVKSGCFFCPFNSLSRWQWLDTSHPDLYEAAIALEEGSKHYPRQRLTDQVFRDRDQIPLRQLRTNGFDRMATREVPCGGDCFT